MRIYYFLFGYLHIYIPHESRAEVATSLVRRGLSAKIDENGYMIVPFFKRKRYERALKKVAYEIVSSGGIPVALIKNRNRIGIFTALAIVAFIYIFSSLFIWDIRVDGNDTVPDSVILNELSDVGFFVGARWGAITCSEAEWALLDKSDDIGWININRRGSIAYVTVKEKTVYPDENAKMSFSNIVATRDCIIEEITVKSGVAAVKAGDVVKAGDLLISGVLPSTSGGGFVAAEGSVLGRVSLEISVEVPRCETNEVFDCEKLQSATLKIFNFKINIFKRYGKTNNTCAIIEDVEEYTLFGKYRIPVTLERIYVVQKQQTERSYTDREIVQIASSRLAVLRSVMLHDAELIKIRTFGEYTEAGYKMTSFVTVLADVGEVREIVGSE